MKDRIVIRNARQHNLKGIDLEIPHRRLVVVTGPSGSGKSSLAFDTVYAEGQRRYVESLSTYAKQFLERMEKPEVDYMEGIPPAVAIEQKNPIRTSRSTVGTATEVQDYMRLLWARAGKTICPGCGREVRPDTVQSATDAVLALGDGTRVVVAFPLPVSARASHRGIVENLREMGFVRVMAGADTLTLDEPGAEDPAGLGRDLGAEETLLVVVDRLRVDAGDRQRLADSVGTAFVEGEGEAVVLAYGEGRDPAPRRLRFSERFRCEEHPEIRFVDPVPRLFSFNNPYGSCPRCTGFGAVLEYAPSLIVCEPGKSLRQGAVEPWEVKRYRKKYRGRLLEYAAEQGVPVDRPWAELPEDFRHDVLHGVRRKGRRFQGVIPFLRSRERKRYKAYIRVFLRRYQLATPCPDCDGARLRPEALHVRVDGRHIADAAAMGIADARAWFDAVEASQVATPILREIRARLSFLDDVGLGYIALDRLTRTLSGGEAQRIALANSLGSSLVDTLYVLDEPTIGLHPRDNDRLIAILEKLRDAGNTVLVVEHDPAVIRRADHVIELGPGSGEKGGHIVFQGTVNELLRTANYELRTTNGGEGEERAGGAEAATATALYLAGRLAPPASRERAVDGAGLELRGARLHNLQGVDVRVPLGTLTVVSGVSGSGKSTLVHDVLFRALERALTGESTAREHLGEVAGAYESLEGVGYVEAVALVDQSPIGRTPRSNPATYTKAFDEVRRIFASQPLSRERGYKPGRFSFNTAGGRCEGCKGDGVVQVEMVFMADVWVPCDVCGGARYSRDTLDVKVKGLSIRDVLDLTVDEAIRFFIREDRLGRTLWQLQQVGLGYLRLGQAAPTLSGGEAQRMKIARELAGVGKGRGRGKGRRVYVMDEPTTGLSGPEVHRLIEVIQKLVDAGHTVLVIEHNLDVIAAADWVIELGPDGGAGGGRIVAEGRPRELAASGTSHTGRYLGSAGGVPPG